MVYLVDKVKSPTNFMISELGFVRHYFNDTNQVVRFVRERSKVYTIDLRQDKDVMDLIYDSWFLDPEVYRKPEIL